MNCAPISRGKCIASRQREAWIETPLYHLQPQHPESIASRQREAWIETIEVGQADPLPSASPPGNGRRGLKPGALSPLSRACAASPPGNGRRGLKLNQRHDKCLCRRASPPGNGRRGLKPHAVDFSPYPTIRIASRQREAWIETNVFVAAVAAAWASPPGNGRRGLKQRG